MLANLLYYRLQCAQVSSTRPMPFSPTESACNGHMNALILLLATFPWSLLCHWYSSPSAHLLTFPPCPGTYISLISSCQSSEKHRECLLSRSCFELPLSFTPVIFPGGTTMTPPVILDPSSLLCVAAISLIIIWHTVFVLFFLYLFVAVSCH